ncbi:primosomal protein N' [Sulfurospirillum sp. 1612]|uniref:primosomal protein N' n=1 Tax=Sulfurospirillum sp. 1612 TaxID=3094835 RepID=UPI002F94BBCF
MKHYFLISLLSSPLSPLTYESEYDLKAGNIVEVTLNKKSRLGVVLSQTSKPAFDCETIMGVKEAFYTPKTLLLAKFISDYYVCSLGDALKLFVPYQKSNVDFATDTKIISPFTLSKAQEKAYEFLSHHERSLLFGDTGSGKTEIYIKMIIETLNNGRNAILLMPEIGLTPQMKKRLMLVFGERVAIWHSKVSKSKKESIIQGLSEGKIALIAGTRSALFLPIPKLGLIVVDEEHDDSYKSSQRPRYNARDLALLFAKRYEAKVVLGSATPTLGSYKNLPKYRLRGTYFDSQKRFFYENTISDITTGMVEKIQEHLAANHKVIIFVPTRANFKYVSCFDCGATVMCPYCSVGMSLHRDKNALVCHYCHYAERIPKVCPTCGGENLHTNRIGTAQIVSELKAHFPNNTIGKFDRDEVRTITQLNAILKDFNEGAIDILVGTQMLSKGHDYHAIGLSIIMGIDAILNMPDFRAKEKAVSLVHQIAGRAGRSGEGEVYIQTQNPEVFQNFMDDYERFLKDEMQHREEIYPPFIKLLKILISHKKDEKAQELLDKVMRIARDFPKIEVVGGGRANIEKIAGKFRYDMLLRSTDSKELLRFAHTCKQLPLEIDIDPLSFS